MNFGFGVGDFIAVLKLVKAVRKQFIDAPGQFQAISDDVKRLSNVLRDIEDNDPGDTLGPDQKATLDEISQGCYEVLGDLNEALAKYQAFATQSPSGVRETGRWVWKRFTWDQSEIDHFRQRISANIGAYELFLGEINRQLNRETKNIVTATQQGVKELVQQQDVQHRRAVLNWLSPITHDVKQADLFSRVQKGTGRWLLDRWLLDSDKFKQWIKQDKDTPADGRSLFCPGLPGAGKTFIASIVVNQLQQRAEAENIGLAFFYCNFREKTELLDMLGVLLRQLMQQQVMIPESMEKSYQKHLNRGTRFTVAESVDLLETAIGLLPKTFIVLDALDECHFPHTERAQLLETIFALQRKHNLALFATCRDNPDITRLFTGKQCLRIRASEEDVEMFLHGRLQLLPGVVQRRPDLQQEVISAISQSIDGMFLLAQLHIDSLQGKRSVKQVREGLKRFPEGLDAAYANAWSRIESQLRDEVQTAKEHALAIESGQSFLDEDNIPEIDDLIAVCGGLVTVEEQGQVVRLVHYTTQEYFERNQARLFPDRHREIGKLVRYLLDRGANPNTEDIDGVTPLERASEEGHMDSFRLLNAADQGPLYAKLPWLLMDAVAAESETMLRLLLEDTELSQKDRSWCVGFALDTAARGAHAKAARFLLSVDGVDVDGKDASGRTAISLVAEATFPTPDAIRMLLGEYGATPDLKDNSGRSPLSYAVANVRHYSIMPLVDEAKECVRLLLDSGRVDIESRDHEGLAPLHHATVAVLSCPESPRIAYTNTPIIQFLLDRGASLESKDARGRIPLTYASEQLLDDVVQMFIDKGAPVDSADNLGRTPLSHAVDSQLDKLEDIGRPLSGLTKVVEIFLANGADPLYTDKEGLTPLSRAQKCLPEGHDALVLLENHVLARPNQN
ncbi:ankyrin repeat-containing domain protein [Aspergillus egyptiacus]|nr:ankyrin repeat-containing domain protein [Aspergillus egyptiacus]